MSTTQTYVRIRAVVVAVLVSLLIPWTYAHIAYAWPGKKQQGDACQRSFTSPNTRQTTIHFSWAVLDRRKGSHGNRSLHGTPIASFGISATSDDKSYDLLGRVGSSGATAPPSRVSAFFTLKEALRHRVVHAQPRSAVLL